MAYENTLTDAQVEEWQTTYRNAVVTVMGDDSDQSRQNAQCLEWAFESLMFAVSEAGGALTEDIIREILPDEVLQLAIHVDWIPYLDEDGEPDPDKQGDVCVLGYLVTQEFYDAFLRLLPIDDLIEYGKKPWVHPTPAEIFQEVLEELDWTKPQFIEQMQIVNGTQSKPGHYELHGERISDPIFTPWQNATERIGLDKLLLPPLPNARRNTAQAGHRNTALEVIRKHSRKYAALEEKQLKWRRPQSSVT